MYNRPKGSHQDTNPGSWIGQDHDVEPPVTSFTVQNCIHEPPTVTTSIAPSDVLAAEQDRQLAVKNPSPTSQISDEDHHPCVQLKVRPGVDYKSNAALVTLAFPTYQSSSTLEGKLPTSSLPAMECHNSDDTDQDFE